MELPSIAAEHMNDWNGYPVRICIAYCTFDGVIQWAAIVIGGQLLFGRKAVRYP